MKLGNNMSIKVVELFAGVGGFRVAMENIGDNKEVEFVWANQWEPGKKIQHAFDCYNYHFGKSDTHVNEDIAKVKHTIPEHDILVGGFPCQDYSVAATGAKGIEGKKGVLWWEIRDIIELKKPKYVFLENVDRLLKSPSSLRGRDFGIMLRTLEELGYGCEWRILNAAEYGFAQRRRRVFIFAFRNDSNHFKNIASKETQQIVAEYGVFSDFKATIIEKNENIKIKSDLPYEEDLVTMSKKFSNNFLNSGIMLNGFASSYKMKNENPHFQTLGSLLQSNVDSKYNISEVRMPKETNSISIVTESVVIEGKKTKVFADLSITVAILLKSPLDTFEELKGAKRIPRLKPNKEVYYYSEGPIAFPDHLNQPARTILTSEGSMNRSTHVIQDPVTKKFRILTPIECERLNGFPDDWTNTGMSERFRYFTMGNALVVPLVRRIAQSIFDKCKDL